MFAKCTKQSLKIRYLCLVRASFIDRHKYIHSKLQIQININRNKAMGFPKKQTNKNHIFSSSLNRIQNELVLSNRKLISPDHFGLASFGYLPARLREAATNIRTNTHTSAMRNMRILGLPGTVGRRVEIPKHRPNHFLGPTAHKSENASCDHSVPTPKYLATDHPPTHARGNQKNFISLLDERLRHCFAWRNKNFRKPRRRLFTTHQSRHMPLQKNNFPTRRKTATWFC